MARARNIKPNFFKNEALAELTFESRLLFIGLWCLADREGLLEDRPKRIKMEVFPADTVDVEPCLIDLANHGFINRYTVGNGHYIEIPKFKKHQNPHYKEVPSTIPKPEALPPMKEPKASGLHVNHEASLTPKPELGRCLTLVDGGVNPADSLIPDSLIPENTIPLSLPTTKPAKGSKRKARTPVPSEFTITAGMESWAIAFGVPASRIDPETDSFLDHHKAKGSLFQDWDAAWRTWMRNTVKFAAGKR